MDKNKDYNSSDYEDDDDYRSGEREKKSIRGYQIVISILAVILIAMSVLYFNIHKQQQQDYQLLEVDRDSIQNNLTEIMGEFDDLKVTNDTIAQNLGVERQRADSLMQRLRQERSWSYAKIKQYEKEVGTLRSVMKGFLRQIDSLNTLNKQLINENVSYKKEISTITQRAEMAEEKATELNHKVRQGSVIKARDIRLVALNKRGKDVSRVKSAAGLRVDFVLSSNDLATPGQRDVYVRITSPDGYVLSSSTASTFQYQGESVAYSASRQVDYQNEDLPVSVYYNGNGFTAGTYLVEVYSDGALIGQMSIARK